MCLLFHLFGSDGDIQTLKNYLKRFFFEISSIFRLLYHYLHATESILKHAIDLYVQKLLLLISENNGIHCRSSESKSRSKINENENK